jgi:two-component system, OmpR family, phosphate regulon sensor histidine kinase PhoR
MKANTIRLVVVLAALSVLGIVITQLFWVSKAFDLEDNEFDMRVNTSLREVARQLNEMDDVPVPLVKTVSQLTQNYFVVMLNGHINTNTLRTLLKGELQKRGIETDCEYYIYDCHSEKMVFGDHIQLSKNDQGSMVEDNLPKWENQPYYFGVLFPEKNSSVIGNMGIWIFSSFVLLLVVAFFTFAMWVIFEQKRLAEVQTDFINNMTHEFKTPISTIAISAGVLQKPEILENPKRLHKYAVIIHNEAMRLKNQVERTLQMATLEEEKIKITNEKVNIHEVITQAVESIGEVVQERDGEVICQLNATHASLIAADKMHLTNIIYNLLDNAVKYCENDPKIVISTQNIGNKIRIGIKDNGIGISKDHLKKVFDKFYRVPTGNLHDVKGFGLGLNYVRIVVSAHGGRVWAESSPQNGTTMWIEL